MCVLFPGYPFSLNCPVSRGQTVQSLFLRSDPGPRAQWGSRPLHMAAQNGHIDAARILLERGAEKEAKDDVRRPSGCLTAGSRPVEIFPLPLPPLLHGGGLLSSLSCPRAPTPVPRSKE